MKKPAHKAQGPLFCICPNCGTMLYHRAKAADWQYGAPLRPCPNCGGEYYDPRYREPALYGSPKPPVLPGTVTGGLLLGFAFLLGAVYLEQKLELIVLGALFFAASAWFAWEYRKNYAKYSQELSEELERSRERLKDPDYRDGLAANGVRLDHYKPE